MGQQKKHKGENNMAKIIKKEKVKKAKVSKNPPTPNAAQVQIDKALKTSDAAVIVTATKGNIEVRAIKNINYAYQVKGLLTGALDSYLVIPISKTLKSINDVNVQLHQHTVSQLKEALGIVEVKPEEKK